MARHPQILKEHVRLIYHSESNTSQREIDQKQDMKTYTYLARCDSCINAAQYYACVHGKNQQLVTSGTGEHNTLCSLVPVVTKC